MRLIDTHCHLNFAEAFPDPASEVRHAVAAGVERMVAVGVDLPTSRLAVELADAHHEVYATVGVHPNSSAGYEPSQLAEIEALAKHPKVAAIGEIGLDFHWDHATREQQDRCLRDQLALVGHLRKPIVFHCREAYPELLDVLEGNPPDRPLLHCFGGGREDLRRALGLGAMFGVDGPITFPKAEDLRAIVAELPRDRVVIETDSPYLTPAPFRGRPNRPAYVAYVNAALASLWKMSPSDCADQTARNADMLFGW